MIPAQNFSITTVPIGLGLTAAAHVYLFTRSLAKTSEQYKLYHLQQQQQDVERVTQSLEHLVSLGEIVDLLTKTTSKFPEKSDSTHPHSTTNIVTTVQSSSSQNEHARSDTKSRRSRRQPVVISVVEMEEWIQAYEELRQSQQVYMVKSFRQINNMDLSFFKLKNNLGLSFALSGATLLRYLGSNAKFLSTFSKRLPRVSRYLSRVWSMIAIPWRWPSQNQQVAINEAATTSPSTSVAWMFIPLVPTLIISGLHFFACARTQWILNEVRNHAHEQMQFVRRLPLLCGFLFVREKRLKWMVQEIRAFEEDQATMGEDGGGGGGQSTGRSDAPRPTTRYRNSHQQVESIPNGASQNGPQRQEQPLIDPSVYSFGPDLENMDVEKFLRDPDERVRILRLELAAMYDELSIFVNIFGPSGLPSSIPA
ncbi:hypothetical protein BG004_004026 [Podila humilis]|nr:hypothetical protein BG004_004026 [Podila humilis]